MQKFTLLPPFYPTRHTREKMYHAHSYAKVKYTHVGIGMRLGTYCVRVKKTLTQIHHPPPSCTWLCTYVPPRKLSSFAEGLVSACLEAGGLRHQWDPSRDLLPYSLHLLPRHAPVYHGSGDHQVSVVPVTCVLSAFPWYVYDTHG